MIGIIGAAGLLTAVLPPAVAAAAPQTGTAPCNQWAFNGRTEFGTIDESLRLDFTAYGQNVNTPATLADQAGQLTGNVSGNRIKLSFSGGLIFGDSVMEDGHAAGVIQMPGKTMPWYALPNTLKCMDV